MGAVTNTSDTSVTDRQAIGNKPDNTPATGGTTTGGGGSGNVPVGGLKYQRLAKNSSSDYDVGWYGPYILNVKDYGAIGDGIANDTTPIANAVADMANNTALYFPPGIYLAETITISTLNGIGIFGDGYDACTIKHRTGAAVMNVSAVTGCTIRGLTFDGNLGTRTAGQHALVADCSNLLVTGCRVVNSGQYSIFVGSGATPCTNVQIIGNTVNSGYADGINLQNVQSFVVNDNVIDGADDDCIAIGYNASGACRYGVVTGNFCRARDDLGTTWGRGIYVGPTQDILIEANEVEGSKQTGIFVTDDGSGTRPSRIVVQGNYVHNVALASGHGICVYKTDYCFLLANVVEDPANGNCIELADWQHLTIQGGVLTQSVNVFCRGIHCDESAGSWATSWVDIVVDAVVIRMLGASTNSCLYFNPDASITLNTGSVTDLKGNQVTAGDYITVATARMGTLWKIGNNVTLSGNTVNPAASAGVYTVFNNN